MTIFNQSDDGFSDGIHEPKRGSIRTKEAYAQGKMLDNSGWPAILPRNISPSDIDMTFDNARDQTQIIVELTSGIPDWKNLKFGQRLAYMGAIHKTDRCAIIAGHSVPWDQEIDTLADIHSFQVMMFNPETAGFTFSQIVTGNEKWRGFIKDWYSDPNATISKFMETYG